MDQPAQVSPEQRGSVLRRFSHDLWRLPGWMKIVLTLAMVAGIAGLAGEFAAKPAVSQPAVVSAPNVHTPGSGFVHGNGGSPPPAPPTPKAPPPAASPWMTRIGFSIVAGYVAGWCFRAFLKLTATIALIFAGLMAGLSYLHIVNVDMTATANTEYKTASAWMVDQAGRLRDAVVAHVPSAGAGFFGMFMGIRKRR